MLVRVRNCSRLTCSKGFVRADGMPPILLNWRRMRLGFLEPVGGDREITVETAQVAAIGAA
jgi:hypothetical protein